MARNILTLPETDFGVSELNVTPVLSFVTNARLERPKKFLARVPLVTPPSRIKMKKTAPREINPKLPGAQYTAAISLQSVE